MGGHASGSSAAGTFAPTQMQPVSTANNDLPREFMLRYIRNLISSASEELSQFLVMLDQWLPDGRNPKHPHADKHYRKHSLINI
jgi:hypothetical protein